MTGTRLAPIPASGQRSTQLRPHSGATGNSPLWKIPKKAELFELECMVFDRVSWSETPEFHNTLVVGSSPTASPRISEFLQLAETREGGKYLRRGRSTVMGGAWTPGEGQSSRWARRRHSTAKRKTRLRTLRNPFSKVRKLRIISFVARLRSGPIPPLA